MNINDVKEYVGSDWAAVQECIASSLESDISILNSTNASILSHGGKQLRPLLSLVMARACSGGGSLPESSIRYAAAAELLHNATLLHDDVADESEQRRGVPTIMSLMGPSVSVLVGDYWLVKAVELVLGASNGDMRVIRLFARTLSDLTEGEMLQLQKAQTGDTNEEDYLRIIYNKTASLFVTACVSAAISVGTAPEIEEAARQFAVSLGIAFQIKDDILDYSGTDCVGKPLGIDILEQKITLPLLGAFINAGSEEERRIRGLVKNIAEHPEYRDEIMDFVQRNGGLEYSRMQLDRYIDNAVKALEELPETKEKEILKALAFFTADRIM